MTTEDVWNSSSLEQLDRLGSMHYCVKLVLSADFPVYNIESIVLNCVSIGQETVQEGEG